MELLGTQGAGPCRNCGQHSPGRWPGERCRPCWDVQLKLRRGRAAAGPTALYRCYDVDGWLLYVGTSLDPERRFQEHAKWFGWWPAVARTEVEWLPFGGQLAKSVETLAICLERPACNAAPGVEVAECGPPMEGGPWFDRVAQLREWRRWFAVWRDCRLQAGELEARESVLVQAEALEGP